MLSRLRKINYLIGKSGQFKFLVLLAMMIINSLLEMVGVGVIPVFIITISDPDVPFRRQQHCILDHPVDPNAVGVIVNQIQNHL